MFCFCYDTENWWYCKSTGNFSSRRSLKQCNHFLLYSGFSILQIKGNLYSPATSLGTLVKFNTIEQKSSAVNSSMFLVFHRCQKSDYSTLLLRSNLKTVLIFFHTINILERGNILSTLECHAVHCDFNNKVESSPF